MKLKSKLIMSGVALAACAATLTSTTYAWYTTNTEVTATGITGATAAAGDTSIFISKDGSSWAQSVTITGSDSNGNFSSAALIPLQYGTKSSTKSLYKFDGTGAGADDVLTFSLYVRTSKTEEEAPIDLYLSKFVVTGTAVTSSDNLLAGKTPDSGTDIGNYGIYTQVKSGVSTVDTYGVDASRALAMYTTANYTGGTAVTQLYDLETSGEKKASTGALIGDTADVDALKYYNAVMNTSLARGTALSDVTVDSQTELSSSSSYAIAKLDQTGVNYTTITFKVFLDGWDRYCFDACKNADFSIELAFTTEQTNITLVNA